MIFCLGDKFNHTIAEGLLETRFITEKVIFVGSTSNYINYIPIKAFVEIIFSSDKQNYFKNY